MKYHRIDVGPGGRPYFRRLPKMVSYMDEVPRLDPGEEYSRPGDYFVLEQALVDGTLPDPSLKWERSGQWIAPYQWDILVYLWSNADISTTTTTFSGLAAARRYCGLNRDIGGERKEQGRRKRDLFRGLEAAGLVREVRRSPQGRRVYRELMLAPVWGSDGLVPSDEPRTWANLSAPDRKWFKMSIQPFTAPSGRRPRCVWADIRHADRRALAALYLHYNDGEFGAVDPNHLCLRGDELVISDAFRRAVGRRIDADEVAQALGDLWRMDLMAFMTATFDEDGPHPGAQQHVRYATRVEAGPNALVGLRHVPRPGE